VAGAFAIVLVLRAYSIASAHVTLVLSEPAAGARLDSPPGRIRLQFSETLDASLARITIVSPDGAQITLRVTTDPSNAYTLLASPALTGTGAFRINWRVVSDDGHPVSGSLSFTVAAASDKPPEMPAVEELPSRAVSLTDVPPLPAILRGLGVSALAALAGLLGFSLRAAPTPAQRRTTMWLAVAAPLFLTAHLFAWLAHTAPDHRLTSGWISAVSGSSAGRIELWRTAFAWLPLWALWLARRPGLAFAVAIPGILLSGAIGHSAAFQPVWSIPLKAIHLIALATWLGGLFWLSTRSRSDTRAFASATLRVSSAALIGVIAIAMSGVAQSLVILPSISSLRSAYGSVIIAKIAGLMILIAFGAYHRFRVIPRIVSGASTSATAAFAGSLHREIVVLWCVALLGGLLAYVPTPDP
jgi:copper transport protein